MKTVRGMADWYLDRGPAFRSLVKSVQTFVLIYGGAILENQVQVLSEGQLLPKDWWHAGLFFVLVMILGVASYNVRLVLKGRERALQDRKDTLGYASSLADQYSSAAAESVAKCLSGGPVSREAVVPALIASADSLKKIVGDTYGLFESRYGESGRIDRRIDFEATFMTKSYVDGEITIAAFANRSRQAPRSMTERATNIHKYDGTETARLYRDAYPRVRIIPDTEDEGVNYQELYPDQKKRIKSSIICPVQSPTSALLGTLVVHCDRQNFFTEEDRRFWEELALVFTRRLALEKLKLDVLLAEPVQSALGLQCPKPF